MLICALLSFIFGALMFFIPGVAADFLAIPFSAATGSVLHGMGGLIIGTGTINFLLRNQENNEVINDMVIKEFQVIKDRFRSLLTNISQIIAPVMMSNKDMISAWVG